MTINTFSDNTEIKNSVNIGSGNTVSGSYAFAQGSGCTANGDSSHAEGQSTMTNNYAEHASGSFNVSTLGVSQDLTALTVDSSATLFSIGNGTSSANTKNAFEVKWNGDAYFSGDTYITKSLNIGRYYTASGVYSFAQGEANKAIGESSHAEGYKTTARGHSSHAEGESTIASGGTSHAEGIHTTSIGAFSHAEGGFTTASGNHSHAEGYGTRASGIDSHTEGVETRANNRGEHASGYYNASISGINQDLSALTQDAAATLFSIGNGIEYSRKNALEVKGNGDIYLWHKGTYKKLQDLLP